MNPENKMVCDGERKQPLHCEINQNYKFEVQVEFEERVKVTWEDIKLKVNANSNCLFCLKNVKYLQCSLVISSHLQASLPRSPFLRIFYHSTS